MSAIATVSPPDFDLRALGSVLEDAQVAAAREDFAAFCEYAMIDDQGKPWQFAPHQREWLDLINEGHPRILIVAPRCSSKTTFVAALILWMLGRDPNLCFAIACGDDSVAIDRLRFLRNNIIDNPRYHKVFPHIRQADIEGEWSKHKAYIERSSAIGIQDASVECASVTSPKTGKRAHWVIFDDIIDSADAIGRPANIAKVKEFVERDWLSMFHPGGRAIMIGTFWCFDPADIHVEYHQRAADGGGPWKSWCKPACELDENNDICGPYLWPGHWGKQALQERRDSSEEAFQQQYLLRGAVQRSQFFNEEHVAQCISTSCSLGDTPFDVERVAIGLDPGGFSPNTRKNKMNSYSCIFVVGLGRTGQKIPLAILRLKAEAEIVARAVIDLWRQWHAEVILVENNATQQMMVSLLRVVASLDGDVEPPVKGKFTGAIKWNPDAGLPAMNAELAQGKWIIPKGGDHHSPRHNCPICDWLNEMHYWGKLMPSGERPHTDIIMGAWLASTALEAHRGFGDIPIAVSRERKAVRFGPPSRVARSFGW